MAKTKYPLFKHRNGQWCKKIGGKLRYFGTDLERALDRWVAEKDYLLAGVQPPRADSRPPVKELANLFIAAKRRAVESGELTVNSADQYQRSIGRFIEIVGAEKRLSAMRPMDFAGVKVELAKPKERSEDSRRFGGNKITTRAATTVGNDIRALRVFFRWCWQNELLETPVRTGTEFSPPSRKVLRRKRALAEPKLFTAKQVASVIAKAKPPLKAIIFLGINAAMGNRDIAALKLSQFSKPLDIDFVDLPRHKTGAARRVWLWPETRQAIARYLEQRAFCKKATKSDLLFLTRTGEPWVRRVDAVETDMISHRFVVCAKSCKMKRTFYDLRRTWRTIAGETLDHEAIRLVMGHVESSGDMGAIYNQHVSDERIESVCQHVRNWLFEGAK